MLSSFFMAALCNRAGHYIFAMWFLSFSSFFFPSPRRRRLDVCHTSTYGVALASANLACRSETCCTRLAENTERKNSQKSPSGHHRTTLLGYIFAIKARIDNRKKFIKQQDLLHMSAQYGQLWLTSGWDRFVSLGHPANFNGFRVLAALLHGTLVLGVSQILWRWTEGATYIRQGGHHVGHRPTF